MAEPHPDPQISALIRLLDQAFHQKSWHGPNLRGSLRGLTPAQATWRPAPHRHSIVEQLLHAAYWKYVVRRRLLGEKRGSFSLDGSNWFPVEDGLSPGQLQEYIKLLEAEHRALTSAVRSRDAQTLDSLIPGGKITSRFLIEGVAFHDIYHAGQINLLKRLQSRMHS